MVSSTFAEVATGDKSGNEFKISANNGSSERWRLVRIFNLLKHIEERNGDGNLADIMVYTAMDDHEGILTVKWRSIPIFAMMHEMVEAAWQAQNEWQVIHEDFAGHVLRETKP